MGYAVRQRCLHYIAITATYCENDIGFRRSIRRMWTNRLWKENGGHEYADTECTSDEGADRSSGPTVQLDGLLRLR